jgi:predicted enzyme related to lactoylglutathione lyase
MAHPVVHFEILGKDGESLQSFYRDLFDWKIAADNPMNYGIVEKGEGGIGGGVSASQDGSSMVTFYVLAEEIQDTLDKAEKLGAKVVMPVMEVPGGPTIALFSDPEGNVVGLVKGM